MLRVRARAAGSFVRSSAANAARPVLVASLPGESFQARLSQQDRLGARRTLPPRGPRRSFCTTRTLPEGSPPPPRLRSPPPAAGRALDPKSELEAIRARARTPLKSPAVERTASSSSSAARPNPTPEAASSPFEKFRFEEAPLPSPTRPSQPAEPPAVAPARSAPAPVRPELKRKPWLKSTAPAPEAPPQPMQPKRKSWLKSTTTAPDVGRAPALEPPSQPPPAKEANPPVLVSSPPTAPAEPRLPTRRLPFKAGHQSTQKATPALPTAPSAPSTLLASLAGALPRPPALGVSSPPRPPPPPLLPPPLLPPPAPTLATPRPASVAASLPAPPLAPPVSAARAGGSWAQVPEQSVPVKSGLRGHSAEASLAKSRQFVERYRVELKGLVVRRSNQPRSVPLEADHFKKSVRQLVLRAEDLPQRELPLWTQDFQSALALGRSGMIDAHRDCVSVVVPAVAFLARQHFTDRHQARTFLEIAADALPWHAPALKSPAAVDGSYDVDVARGISEILRAVTAHVADIAAESFGPRQDLMTSLALEQYASSVDRRALDGIRFIKGRVLTRSVHHLQQREAYFGIRTTHDVVDFARRWLSPDTTLGMPWYWSELLDVALRADVVPPPSVDHVVEYAQTCTKMIDLAAEALKGADDIVLLQIRTKELLSKIEAIDGGWGSAFTRQLHMLVLDFLAVQVPKVFVVGEISSAKRVNLDRHYVKVVERAFKYHPDPDSANALTPLLVSLAHSGLAADAPGLPRVLRTALASGKVDSAYLIQHGFLDRLRLAFPREEGSAELAALGSRSPGPSAALAVRAQAAGDALPNVDDCLRQCRSLDGGSLNRAEKDAVIQQKLHGACTAVIKHVRAMSRPHRQLGPGQRHSFQSAGLVQVGKVRAYVNGRQWNDGESEAEALTSVMNALNFCGEHADALAVYDRLRRFPLSLKEQGDWHSRALSIIFDVCGQAREGKYHVWGLDVWRDFRASGVPLNSRHWESYREFLARHSDHDKWLDTLPLRFSTPGADPRLNEPMLEASLVLAMAHMTAHSKNEVRNWFQTPGTAWHKERWNQAQRKERFGTAFQLNA